MEEITLDSLIKEHKERIPQLHYEPSPPGCIGFSYYYYDDSACYQKWLATTKRYLGITFPNDKDIKEFVAVSSEDLSPEQQRKLPKTAIPNSNPRTNFSCRIIYRSD